MTDMRRTILWVVFTMSLFLLWDAWNKHNGQPSFFSPSKPATVATGPAATPNGDRSLPSAATSRDGTPVVPQAESALTSAPASTFTVSTDTLKVTISGQGATLERVELLKQREQTHRAWYEAWRDLFAGPRTEDVQPTNVVLLNKDSALMREYVAQTGLIGGTDQVKLPNHLSSFTMLPGDTELAPGKDTLDVVFDSAEQGGVKLRKTLSFKRGAYLVKVRHEVINTSSAALSPQLYLQLVRDGNVEAHSLFLAPTSYTGPAVYTDAKKFQKADFKDIEKGKVDHDKTADNGWVAMVQHYYFSAWLHNEKTAREFYTRKVDTNLYAVGQLLPVGSIEPGATKTIDSELYMGPQEEKKIELMAPGLELVKDYGIFTIIAKPLFWLLDQLHTLIGNWGWAIVALVVLLKAAFYSLNAAAYKSMAKQKAITPRITELRERLKDKPQQMQQEMMRIYKEEKVNPLGGCLPILIQMPVFIALYWVLLSSVEMRNAPWIGWITDLSVKDPFYILPIVMTGTTLLQTWLNPTPPDPMQARMMWIMPLVFSVMFFVFPAGLVLYWITNNLLSIAQQWVINRRLGLN